MSPILVRPVREQLEHDRVIRLLQAKLKRRHDIAVNVGEEQTAAVKAGAGQVFPDLVLTSQDRSHRVEAIIEVETGESVNHLEAMAQWAHFGRLKPAFHLYVPTANVEIARRLVAENQVNVAELWSYHTIADQTRFTLVERSSSRPSGASRPRRPAPQPARTPRAARPVRKAPAAARAKRPAARSAASKPAAPAKQKRK